MSPQEREALRERYDAFSQLPPDKQQIVRERLRGSRALPGGRRQVVSREIQQLRRMPEGQRQARMNSEKFRKRFSPPEQLIIRDITTYLP
jgi:hypothetical protein